MPLFDEKDEGLVKAFLFNKIESECDADPGIMADYILVTLQNDMSQPELKQHCKTDLVEFFGDKTNVFVDTLFDSLDSKQYLPTTDAPKQNHHDNHSNGAVRTSIDIRGSSARTARDDSHHQRNSATTASSRRRSRSPDSRHSGQRDRRRQSRSPSRGRHAREPRSFDPTLLNGPLEPGRLQTPQHQQQQQQQFQQQLQPQFQQQPFQNQQQFQRKRRPCFEFLRKGTCQRGDACTYAHVTAEQAQAMGMQVPQNMLNAGGSGPQLQFGMGRPPQMMAPPGFFPPTQQQHQQHHQQQQHGMPPMGQHNPGGAAGHQPFPMSTTKIFVTNIPDDCLNDSAIGEFFGKFGEIKETRIDYTKHNATVEFADNNAQTQALSTPEAIFNNRFVRVHKARDYAAAKAANGSADQHGDSASGGTNPPPAQQQPLVWRPKSAAIKKAEMIEKYVEQQKELMKKLTTIKDMPPATRKIIMDSINQIQTKIDDIRKPKSETTAAAAATAAAADSAASEKQALQSKLQALQQEAARLGMSPKGNVVRPAWSGPAAGAGSLALGGPNAGGGAARGSMSLDKRPRSLVLRNVEQSAAERLDSELAQFGEIETISKAEDGVTEPPFTYTVRYKARWEAENALKAVTSIEGFGSVNADWGSQ
ncbi:hypothetical protein EV175_004135 [Coemansia sp. RSA 1933]|nr:hypothetical protein EV175_004135 [Coemansia sp. RSA 1933]